MKKFPMFFVNPKNPKTKNVIKVNFDKYDDCYEINHQIEYDKTPILSINNVLLLSTRFLSDYFKDNLNDTIGFLISNMYFEPSSSITMDPDSWIVWDKLVTDLLKQKDEHKAGPFLDKKYDDVILSSVDAFILARGFYERYFKGSENKTVREAMETYLVFEPITFILEVNRNQICKEFKEVVNGYLKEVEEMLEEKSKA